MEGLAASFRPSRSQLLAQRALYCVLFVFLFGSIALFVVNGLGYLKQVWEWYNRAYLATLLVYTWFTMALLFYSESKRVSYPAYEDEKIAVIMPCFNESGDLLKRSVESVIAARGNKQILIIDDGSTNDTKQYLQELSEKHRIFYCSFPENKGKRHALHYAVTQLVRDCDFVVTIDSDTVLDPDALVRVVEPLKVPAIGASTGDVLLLNEKQNWLTRMIGSYYWIGLHIYKKAQSSLGMVVCCSGCLAAYRTEVVMKIIDAFVNQEFFGEKCTHSEDRHLTNLVLQNGLDVVFVPEAISHTETPATIRGFLKQQQRWKRGYIRESLYTLAYSWRIKPLLFLQILLWDLTIPFLSIGLMLALLVSVITQPLFFLTAILPSWIAFMIVRYMPIFMRQRSKIFGLFVYLFFYDIFLYWQSIYALFTVKNKSWITR